MNIEIEIHGRLAGRGTVGDNGDLVGIEWCDGWVGQSCLKRADLPMLAEQGAVFRQDNTIPHEGGTMTRGDGSTMRFGPGRMRITRLP